MHRDIACGSRAGLERLGILICVFGFTFARQGPSGGNIARQRSVLRSVLPLPRGR